MLFYFGECAHAAAYIGKRNDECLILFRLREICRSDGQIRQKCDRSDKTYVLLGLNVRHCLGPTFSSLPMSVLGFLDLVLKRRFR